MTLDEATGIWMASFNAWCAHPLPANERVAREAAATVIQQAFAERDGEIERLREALKPLVFFDMGKDEDEGAPFTTQDVWETIFKDRVQDWFDFADIEAARQALAAKGDSRG